MDFFKTNIRITINQRVQWNVIRVSNAAQVVVKDVFCVHDSRELRGKACKQMLGEVIGMSP